jgi:hypothetical protein
VDGIGLHPFADLDDRRDDPGKPCTWEIEVGGKKCCGEAEKHKGRAATKRGMA